MTYSTVPLHLYGNTRKREITYRDEFDGARHINVIHVLSEPDEQGGETAYITTDLLKKHLTRPLHEYEFLLCGPPVMINTLEPALREEHVPHAQIHHELFDY